MRAVLYLDGKFYNTPGNWLLNCIVIVTVLFWVPVIGADAAEGLLVSLAPFFAFIPSFLATSSVMDDVANGILAIFHQSSRSLTSYVLLKMLTPLGIAIVSYSLNILYLLYIHEFTARVVIGYAALVSTLVIAYCCVLPFCLTTSSSSIHQYQSLTAVIQGVVIFLIIVAEILVNLNQSFFYVLLAITVPLAMALITFLVSLSMLHNRYVDTLGTIDPVDADSEKQRGGNGDEHE